MEAFGAQKVGIVIAALVGIVAARRFVRSGLDAIDALFVRLWLQASRVLRMGLVGMLVMLLAAFLGSEGNREALYKHLRQHFERESSTFLQYYFGPVLDQPEDPELPVRRLLVVGEVGDGKSTLINALRDPVRSEPAEAGRAARGVTKQILTYVGQPINGHPVLLLDTPGVGDKDITPTKLITMLEKQLLPPFDGVLVTNPIPDGRVKLGAQVVSTIIDHGFVGTEKWSSVVLVGTKNDRAEDEAQRQFFLEDIRREFFSLAPEANGAVCLTSKDDYSQLRAQIAKLPRLHVHYRPANSTMMALALAESFGMRMEDFQKQLREERDRMRQEYTEELQKLQHESQVRFKESEVRETELKEKLEMAQRMAEDAVGAAKVVAERRLAEVRSEFEQQLAETQQLRLAFDEKQKMWETVRERLANFEERELKVREQNTQLRKEMNEQIVSLQAEQVELRKKLALLEDQLEDQLGEQVQSSESRVRDREASELESIKSELQRQLEATEERLEVLHNETSSVPDHVSGGTPAGAPAAEAVPGVGPTSVGVYDAHTEDAPAGDLHTEEPAVSK